MKSGSAPSSSFSMCWTTGTESSIASWSASAPSTLENGVRTPAASQIVGRGGEATDYDSALASRPAQPKVSAILQASRPAASRFTRMTTWIMIVLALLLAGPLYSLAFGKVSVRGDWRTATHRAAGLAPDPATHPDAVVQ